MALQHARPRDVVDLTPYGPLFDGARTRALVKSDSFEAVRLVIPAGTAIARHQVDGEITLQCLEGHVEIGGDTTTELRPGEWMYLPGGSPHSVRALENSSLLLTIILDCRRTDFAGIDRSAKNV